MLPYIHIILPSYAVMAFIGAFSILMFLYFRFEKYGLLFNQFIRLFVICSLTCFLGSKLLFFTVALLSAESTLNLSEILLLFLGSGYVFYGGLMGTLIGIWIFAKRESNVNIHSLYQMTAPALPLFHGFGRIGCFMAGCCYGIPLNKPFILFGIIEFSTFPTQLLEALFEFSMFLLLCIVDKFKKGANLLILYLSVYAIFRFCIEFYRADTDRGMWLWFSTSQWISILIILYFIMRWLKNKSKEIPKKHHLNQ